MASHSTKIFLLAILLSVTVLWSHPARAFDIDYAGGDSFSLQSGDYERLCKSSDITAAIGKLQSGYVQRVLSNLRADFQRKFREFAFRIAACIAGSSTYFGTGPSGAMNCSTSVGSDMSTEIQQQYLTKLENDFLANCTARVALNSALDAGAAILAENGRDGGAAFVQDYRQMREDARYRGLQNARNDMANTNYCPWLRGYMAGYFNFNPGNGSAMAYGGGDGLTGYPDNAACSAPIGFDPMAPESQTTEAIAMLTLPNNSIYGSYLLGQEHIQSEMTAEEQADEDQFVPTGGIGGLADLNPATGTSCVLFDTDGTTCLKYGFLKQPPAGLKADVEARRQAQYDWLVNSREANSMVQDVRLRMFSSLLDATSKAIDTQFQVDIGAQDVIDNPNKSVEPPPTPSPAACPVPLPAPPPDCACAYNDPATQILAQTIVLEATRAAVLQQSPPDGSMVVDGKVVPGREREFLGAVCAVTIFSSGLCHPSSIANDQIVIVTGGMTFAVDIIGPDNSVLMPGRTVNSCVDNGVQ